jgi:hypothetical protein
MDPENIAKDFKKPGERAAIAAVLQWMGFNSMTAWYVGKHRHLSTTYLSKTIHRKTPYEATVTTRKQVDRLEKVFANISLKGQPQRVIRGLANIQAKNAKKSSTDTKSGV